MRRAHLLAIATMAAAAMAAFAFVHSDTPHTHRRMRQAVYVWQRVWTPSVRNAVDAHARSFDETVVLGAEIAWRDGVARTTYVDLPYAAGPRRVGVALRIGPSPRAPGTDATDRALVAETASALIASARTQGVEPSELQLDYDCAESKLDGYADWLAAVREAVAPVPVTLTALPSWLDRAAFARLARASDGFVLQVHSLEPPASAGDAAPLCDADRAARWAEQAARVGVPFRVALPTYGYALAWSRDGKFLGAAAEGAPPTWPRGAVVRELSADANAMASLVRRWNRDRPAALRGVVWFRLPVDGDARNWRWTTLARAMRGRDTRPRVVAETARPCAELLDVSLANCGTSDGIAADVEAAWTGAPLVGCDAAPGFVAETVRDGLVRFRRTGDARLAPGAAQRVGWLRLGAAAEVDVHVAR